MSETVDQRVTLAREYLASIRIRPVATLPPLVLVRECAELRRQLGAVLAALDDGMLLDRHQAVTVLAALGDAAGHIRERAACCPDCDASPADLCGGCAGRLSRAEAYDALAAR